MTVQFCSIATALLLLFLPLLVGMVCGSSCHLSRRERGGEREEGRERGRGKEGKEGGRERRGRGGVIAGAKEVIMTTPTSLSNSNTNSGISIWSGLMMSYRYWTPFM